VFGQSKSEEDGGIAVQPDGIDKVTSRTGTDVEVGDGADAGAAMAGAVKLRVSGVWAEA